MSTHRKPSDKVTDAAAAAGAKSSSTSHPQSTPPSPQHRGYTIVGVVFALMLLALLAVRFQYGNNLSSHVAVLDKNEAALGLATYTKRQRAAAAGKAGADQDDPVEAPLPPLPSSAGEQKQQPQPSPSRPPPPPQKQDPAPPPPPPPPPPAVTPAPKVQPPLPQSEEPSAAASANKNPFSTNFDDVDVSGIQPLSPQALFDRRKKFGPMKEDPHPRDPAVDGVAPAYKGPKRGAHQLPVCQFNAKEAATAMKEDPNYILPVPTIGARGQLPRVAQCEGMKRGAELGVQKGVFSQEMLQTWKSCTEYWLVDLWAPQQNYHDVANVGQDAQNHHLRESKRNTNEWKDKIKICRNFTTECAKRVPDDYFDYIYVDARHDRLGVMADLEAWWPKLRRGGLMCGHDYVIGFDIFDRSRNLGQDWTTNFDGSRDQTNLIVRGAIDDFFMAPQVRKTDHYRQVVVTHRESMFNTFCVRK